MLETALWVLVYFLPTIVGFYRKHHRAWAIFAINLLLGWTVVGWIIAMVWASTRASLSPDRRDRQAMLNMRATMDGIQKLLFPKDEMTGALVRMKTGLHLEEHLNRRLGIMGPDFFKMVSTDFELEEEAEIIDRLPPERLDQLATELGRSAERTYLEKGEPDTWKDGEDTKNVAALIALRLLSGWLKCKPIVHTSMNREVVKEAQDLDDLYYTDIKRLLRIFHGEQAIKEGEDMEEGTLMPTQQ